MIKKKFKISGSPDIEVRIESGRVEVQQGNDDEVVVEVETKDPNFIVEQRGSSVVVSSDKSSSWLSRGSAYVSIQTPEGSDLRVGVASAAVSTTVPLGKLEIKSASGDIDIDRAQTIEIKSASGDTFIQYVGRSLRFASASGDLDVSDTLNGSASIATASGDIDIHDATGSVDVNTVSGDVRISRFSGKTANFKAMSGDVHLGLPRATTVDLDVNLLSGSLELPTTEPGEHRPSEREMTVRAKLVSGDLYINRAD